MKTMASVMMLVSLFGIFFAAYAGATATGWSIGEAISVVSAQIICIITFLFGFSVVIR